MKATVYNLSGKEAGSMELPEAIFNVAVKPEVVHEVFVAQMNNQREPWADTKNRGEVSGGGKKPWAQKGTGRARHGSIRSPIWKGGGVTFGPLSIRSYKTKINKKTRRLATKMCLSDKAQSGALIIVENFNFTEPKTKLMAAALKALPTKLKSFLVVSASADAGLMKVSRNIPRVTTQVATDLSVMDLLNTQALIMTKEAVEKLAATLQK
jgi:large subunit ribosomal protein L4